MPASINGFGTKYYGEADLRPDGSFITTEWITLAYLPVIPIRSYRLARIPGGVTAVVYNSTSYAVFEKLPVHWPQVLRVYSFVLLAAGWTTAMMWIFFDQLAIFDRPNSAILMFVFIATLIVPFLAVWWIRREKFKSNYTRRETPPPLP